MARTLDSSQVTSASDFCINSLVEATEAGKDKEFDPAKVLDGWARRHGINDDKDRKSFVEQARAMFETQVVVLGLKEAACGHRRLFSPVYTLFHPERPAAEAGLDEDDE